MPAELLTPVMLRPRTAADDGFLLAVYASTREEEMAMVPWSAEQKHAFLADQFRLQSLHFDNHYSDAAFDIIEYEGNPAGRLYVHRVPNEIYIMDIAILPAFRGRGIGTTLLRKILAEGRESGVKVTCHAEFNNPGAQRLYNRLGFRKVDEVGIYFFMECTPNQS